MPRGQHARNRESEAVRLFVVLQGGGALGAYQAGVYHALHEGGIEPDWIIGTSIGAVNASLIAGNAASERLERLKEFWTRMAYRPPFRISVVDGDSRHDLVLAKRCSAASRRSSSPMPAPSSVRTFRSAWTRPASTPRPLWRRRSTRLVDFELINNGGPRLTVGAAHVRTSTMKYFDSREMPLGAKHIMASGALPPAFPAVRIDGEPIGTAASSPIRRPKRSSTTIARRTRSSSRCTLEPGRGRAELDLGGVEPPEGHSVFQPRREPYRAAASASSHAPHRRRSCGFASCWTSVTSPRRERSPPTGARRSRMSCVCSRRSENESHTEDVDFSPAAFARAGRLATRRPCGRLNNSPGAGVRSTRRCDPARA